MTSTLPTPRLFIVCGLPGSGKTTLAKKFERTLGAIRMCPDEWMQQLAIDLWDETRRAWCRIATGYAIAAVFGKVDGQPDLQTDCTGLAKGTKGTPRRTRQARKQVVSMD